MTTHNADSPSPIDLGRLPLGRFYSRVADAPSGCLEWHGPINNKGYGVLSVAGRMILAHRVSWAVHHGVDPGRRLVLHKCDNPRCVREEHLYLGNFLDNARDCSARGRRRVAPSSA